MANSQTNNYEYSENKKQRRIERKYNNLIAEAITNFGDRTLGELFEYLDMLKAEMQQELIKAGVVLEDK